MGGTGGSLAWLEVLALALGGTKSSAPAERHAGRTTSVLAPVLEAAAPALASKPAVLIVLSALSLALRELVTAHTGVLTCVRSLYGSPSRLSSRNDETVAFRGLDVATAVVSADWTTESEAAGEMVRSEKMRTGPEGPL